MADDMASVAPAVSKRAKARAKARMQRKAMGKCADCFRVLDGDSRWRCTECLAHARQRLADRRRSRRDTERTNADAILARQMASDNPITIVGLRAGDTFTFAQLVTAAHTTSDLVSVCAPRASTHTSTHARRRGCRHRMYAAPRTRSSTRPSLNSRSNLNTRSKHKL